MTQPSPIAGMPLRYLIGASHAALAGEVGCVTMVPWLAPRAKLGLTAGYVNAFDESTLYDPESNEGMFGPYRAPTQTAREYGEGVPDQEHAGYTRNIASQLELRARQGITLCEIDNPDAYPLRDVLRAITWAQELEIGVLAKNPLLGTLDRDANIEVLIQHPNVVGMIVEHGAGHAITVQALRLRCGRERLPIRFVAYQDGEGGPAWARNTARDIKAEGYLDMGVTICEARREYSTSTDVLRPITQQGGEQGEHP